MSRLKSSRGMTFMELLCAVLILMMSTALVLVGVNLGADNLPGECGGVGGTGPLLHSDNSHQ